jgi:hypothetical protein
MSALGTSAPAVLLRLEYAPHESGMSRLPPVARKKYGRARSFYGCNSPNSKRNYVDYVNEGSEEKTDYVAYSGDGEKSRGVFDRDGLMSKERQAALKKKLRTTKSVIWFGLLSFTTEFGNKYMTDNADAFRLMTTELPRFFKNAGLNPDNITWYAGLHENTKHKHIHFSFFENAPLRFTARSRQEPRYSEGHIPKEILARFKVSAERRMTDITAELRAARQKVTDIMRNVLFSDGNKSRNTASIQEQMLDLIPLLPADGRLSYASGSMARLRPGIDRIADLLIKSNKTLYDAFNVFCNAATGHDERIKKMLIAQRIDKKSWDGYLTADKTLADFYRRFGNFIINTARVFKDKEKPKASRIVRKQAGKHAGASALKHCLRLGAYAEREAMNAFSEYMAKLKEEEFRNAKQNDKEQPQNEIE